ncbi:MAG: DUF521 domain-containing protein, partial [Chloroflexi bacterium]|nr:DUF521 domain-containing protein [Chloroflexota bacterium]
MLLTHCILAICGEYTLGMPTEKTMTGNFTRSTRLSSPAASRAALHLTDEDRAMLAGERGPAVKMAMSIVARMAEIFGASELMNITGAHIDSTIYIGEAGLEFAEKLASLGARVA